MRGHGHAVAKAGGVGQAVVVVMVKRCGDARGNGPRLR
jgi:hypothetical protein